MYTPTSVFCFNDGGVWRQDCVGKDFPILIKMSCSKSLMGPPIQCRHWSMTNAHM